MTPAGWGCQSLVAAGERLQPASVDGRPLYEALVARARELHMAGATVLRGPPGFGRSSLLHTAKILRLSQDLPMVIEIVDAEQKISAFIS
jgi:uncharacterized protein